MSLDRSTGLVRNVLVPNLSEGQNGDLQVNNRGEQIVAAGLLPKTQLVALGNSWCARIATANAFTHVAAMPTTRYELALYNGEPSNGKSYVIDAVWHLGITSMAAAGSVIVLAQYVPQIAALTDDTAQLITSRSGKTYGGNGKRAVAGTTMVANKWEVLQSSNAGGSATAQIGLGSYAPVDGGFILRPGDTFGVNVVAGTAAGTAIMGIVWHEVQLACA